MSGDPYATPENRDRSRSRNIAWLLLIAVLIGGIMVSVTLYLQAQRATMMAQEALMRAEMERARSEQMAQELAAERAAEQPDTSTSPPK